MERTKSSFPDELKETPQELRKRHKRLREEMTKEEAGQAGEQICQKILESDWYKACTVLYGYYPLRKEVNCLPVLRQALQDGKTVALPRTEEHYQMNFYRIASLEEVTEGKFHVMEPEKTCELCKETPGVVLTPGVVFDKTGGRYGYGKGYYDRYFVRYPGLLRVGLAYEHQLEEALLLQSTDIRMNRVITDGRIWDGTGGTL